MAGAKLIGYGEIPKYIRGGRKQQGACAGKAKPMGLDDDKGAES